MDKNKKIGLVIGGVVVLAITFYAGMTYGGNNVRASISSRGAAFGPNGAGTTGMMRTNRGGNFGGFTNGQIISKDANSITIQITNGGPNATGQQGGSRIVFLDTNTKVTKSVSRTTTDLTVGTEVSVTGVANPDGSVNAQSVQIRPATPTVVR